MAGMEPELLGLLFLVAVAAGLWLGARWAA